MQYTPGIVLPLPLYRSFLAVALLWASACRDVSRAESGKALIVGRPADAISLDPARITDNESVEVVSQIYEPLLNYSPTSNEIEPGLAQSWEVSPDGRMWTFHLREGVEFHDGTPLTAEAVVFSFQRQLDPSHPYHLGDIMGVDFAWRAAYKNIQSVEAVGPLSVRITIARKFAPFAANLSMFPVSIVSPAAVRKHRENFSARPVGTGPFRFEDWDRKRGRIVLERNENYWGDKPRLRRLVFKAIPDGRQRLVALESGSIHVAYSILPDEQQFVSLHPKLRLYRAAGNNVSYLAMNTQRAPLTDVRVRQAINYAINKEPIVKLAYQGMAVAADGALPPGQWGFVEESFGYEYNPGKARAILATATMDGSFDPEEPLKLYVPTTPRPYLTDPLMVARIVKSNLESVGMTVEVVEKDFAGHLKALRRAEHDLGLMGWVGDNGDPDNYLYVLFDSDNARLGTARNMAFLKDSSLDAMLRAAQKVDSRQERSDIYTQAQTRIGDLAPWVPLAHAQVSVVASSEVVGLSLDHTSQIVYEEVDRK